MSSESVSVRLEGRRVFCEMKPFLKKYVRTTKRCISQWRDLFSLSFSMAAVLVYVSKAAIDGS
jgi:hypothetical protein